VIVADAASTQAVNERINAQTASTQAVEQAQLAATAQVVAQTERDKANQNAAEARISQLAAQALANQSKEYDLALLLSVEAFHRKDSYQTRSSLFDTLEYSPRLVRYETAMGSLDYTVFTNDGKYLLSIFTPDVYKMDAETYEVIGQPFHRNDNDKVYSIAISPDDQTLAVEYEDAIVLYDMTTQEEKVEFPVTTHNDFTTIKFSPDGLFLATDDDNAAIQLWDIKTYEQFGSTMTRADGLGTGNYIRDMEFSPDGTTLAVSYKDDMLFWNYRTQQPTGSTIPVEYGGIMSITYSPDGSILALGTTEDTILLWDPNTQEQITEPLTGHTDVVSSVAFSSDGKILASGSWDKAVILWNMDTYKRIGSPLLGHSGEVYQVAFSPDGSYLLSGGNDSYTILWDLRNSYSLGTVLGENSSINSVVFSPDGKTVISGGADNWLYLWNAETGEPAADPMNIAENTAANIEVKKIAYAPDGNFLAVAIISDPVVKLWDLTATPPKAYPLTGVSNTASVNDLAFSPDGTTLVAGDNEGRLTFWNVADQRQIDSSIQPEGQGQIQSIAFSPDGKVMAYSGDFGKVRFVDMAARTLQQNNLDYEENVGTLAYSPDGSILAVSSSDKIKLWSTSTLESAIAPMGGEQDPVESMSFSPDGKILAASYFDNMIILWDVASGQRLGEPIRGDQSKVSVNSLDFSPDGQILATGASNGQFILWYMNPATWTDIACSIANRNLTDTEWLRYVGADEPYAKTCPNYP
jgi:WD40 repeat protein